MAAKYPFVAYTLRYHGTSPWPDDGRHYSTATHLDDLTTFIRRFTGPLHLLGLSMGGRLATLVALEHPELLLSLTVLKPPLDDLLDDLPEARSARDEWRKGSRRVAPRRRRGCGAGHEAVL